MSDLGSGHSSPAAPTVRTRLVLAVAIGGFVAILAWIITHRPAFEIADFHQWWLGAHARLALYALTRGSERSGYFHTNSTAIVLAMYLPALVMVLARPNEGTVPDWLERGSAALPRWLRGASTTAVKPAR